MCGAVTQCPSRVCHTPSSAVSVATKWPGPSAPLAHPRVPGRSAAGSSLHRASWLWLHSPLSPLRPGPRFLARQSQPQGQPRGLVPPPRGLGLDQSLLQPPLLPAPAGDAWAPLHLAEIGSDLGSGLDVLVPEGRTASDGSLTLARWHQARPRPAEAPGCHRAVSRPRGSSAAGDVCSAVHLGPQDPFQFVSDLKPIIIVFLYCFKNDIVFSTDFGNSVPVTRAPS